MTIYLLPRMSWNFILFSLISEAIDWANVFYNIKKQFKQRCFSMLQRLTTNWMSILFCDPRVIVSRMIVNNFADNSGYWSQNEYCLVSFISIWSIHFTAYIVYKKSDDATSFVIQQCPLIIYFVSCCVSLMQTDHVKGNMTLFSQQ